MTALVLEGITLAIAGRTLFPPLDLQVAPGAVRAVIGPSGSGKSSLLAFICGTLTGPFEARGRVLLRGRDVTPLAPEQRHIGILFQEPLLFPHLDVRGNLMFGLRAGGSLRERREAVDRELEAVDLAGFGSRDPATLSGGQKARVALLRVLLSKPDALLLDEPFGALDRDTRAAVREWVFAEVRRRALPTLLVSHDERDFTEAAEPAIHLESPWQTGAG